MRRFVGETPPGAAALDYESKDATPTGFTLCGATLWIGDGIVLADMPEGTACMMWREGGGWLVGTSAQLDAARKLLDAGTTLALDAAEALWGVVANASGGDWTKETAEWQGAAARARDLYHAALDARRGEAARSPKGDG